MALDFGKSRNNSLSKAIKKTEDANAKLVKNIPVSVLIETADNEFIFGIDSTSVKRLAEEIDEDGFNGSIMVTDLHDGTYQVVSGHQRLRAMKELGKTTIPCIVEDIQNESDLYRKLLSSNVLQRKMTPLAYARAIDAYETKVLTKDEVARLSTLHPELRNERRKVIAHFFNISTGQVYRYQAITRMPAEIQEMCKDPEFPYTALESAASLTDEQKQLLLNAINEYNQHKGENDTLSKNVLTTIIDNIKKASIREDAKQRILNSPQPEVLPSISSDPVSNNEPDIDRSENNQPPRFDAEEPSHTDDVSHIDETVPVDEASVNVNIIDNDSRLDSWVNEVDDDSEKNHAPVWNSDAKNEEPITVSPKALRTQAAATNILNSIRSLASIGVDENNRSAVESLKSEIDKIFETILK